MTTQRITTCDVCERRLPVLGSANLSGDSATYRVKRAAFAFFPRLLSWSATTEDWQEMCGDCWHDLTNLVRERRVAHSQPGERRVSDRRFFIRRTVTESYEYDPAEVDRLWNIVRPSIPPYMLGGDEDTDEEARTIAVFTAFNDALVSPFGTREDYDTGYELYAEDEDGNPLPGVENGQARPPTTEGTNV